MDATGSVEMKSLIASYQSNLIAQIELLDTDAIEQLARHLILACEQNKQVFLCGNGGSAGNAMHLANDFLYGIDPSGKKSLNVEALPANSSVITCLGNDIGYENIFSHQLKVKAKAGDLLIVLSGSGNSANILNALRRAKANDMTSYAVLGYQGGEAKNMADVAIHSAVDDMQIAEDLQLIIGHMIMQFLAKELTQ